MTLSLDDLRRQAKLLHRAFDAGELTARQRVQNYSPQDRFSGLKHADFLFVVAREQGFRSWPALKLAAETRGLSEAQAFQRLKYALMEGHHAAVDRVLAKFPALALEWVVQIAMYDRSAVAAKLEAEPQVAVRDVDGRVPLVWLAFSRHFQRSPDKEGDMLAIAQMLLDHGADVNASTPVSADNDHQLSALYGAIGHGNNMPLGRLLLAEGANPNDGESLYHATELGHHEGLRLLLSHGADPKGTNALLRAMDFDDVEAVQMLLDAGAEVEDFDGTHVGGEAPWVIPALHQAARRMCSRKMVDLLLAQGADPKRAYQGANAYAYARVYGNATLARAIEAQGAPELSQVEALLATAVEGPVPEGRFIDPEIVPEAFRNIIRLILHLPGKLDHVKRLVALGLEYDRPDTGGLTPVQVAGWEGLPEVMAYFLSLKPDLAHVNGYGGTLFSTILHGAQNCPARSDRDHIGCLRLALQEGVALPRRALDLPGDEDIRAFLVDWSERHPGQVIDGGAA